MNTTILVDQLRFFHAWPALAGGRIIIACSGGPDSTALACVTAGFINDPGNCALWAGTPPQIALWHLDHVLRENSATDAEFVRALAEKLGAQFILEREDIGTLARQRRQNIEAVARERRYALLDRQCAGGISTSASGAAFAFTAHNRNDQAETVLMRLLRGAYPEELQGIRYLYNERIIRPWLAVPREAVMKYLHDTGQEYVTDESNMDLTRTRNKIRHTLLPLMQECSKDAIQHIADLTVVAGQAVDFALLEIMGMQAVQLGEQELAQCLPLMSEPHGAYSIHIAASPWINCSTIDHYLRKVLLERGNPPGHKHMLRLGLTPLVAPKPVWVNGWSIRLINEICLSVCGPARQVAVPAQIKLSKRGWNWSGYVECKLDKAGQTAWNRHARDKTLDGICGEHHWPEMMESLYLGPPESAEWECFLPDTVKLPLELRTWHPGDKIALPGGGTKKLSDVFVDAQVPRPFRHAWIILVDADDRIMWVPGLADSRWMAIDHGALPAHHVRLIAKPPFNRFTAVERANSVLLSEAFNDAVYERALALVPDDDDSRL